MVKLTSVALAVAGVVALGSTGVVSSSEGGKKPRSSETFRSADDLIVHNNMRGQSGSRPLVSDSVSHSSMDTVDIDDHVNLVDPLGRAALRALETPSNDGCAKFERESADDGQDIPFLREQCLDEQGLTYFTKNEVMLADRIKREGGQPYDVLSREALVNHRVNQVDSCKQLLRTGRHMRSVYKFKEREILRARDTHRRQYDPWGEDREEEDDEQSDDDDDDQARNEIVDEHDDDDKAEQFKARLDAFEEEQLRPYMVPMSSIADTCMHDLLLLNGQGCAGKRTRAFIGAHGPRLKDTIEVDITSRSRGTTLMDALNTLSITANAVCPPPSRGSF